MMAQIPGTIAMFRVHFDMPQHATNSDYIAWMNTAYNMDEGRAAYSGKHGIIMYADEAMQVISLAVYVWLKKVAVKEQFLGTVPVFRLIPLTVMSTIADTDIVMSFRTEGEMLRKTVASMLFDLANESLRDEIIRRQKGSDKQ